MNLNIFIFRGTGDYPEENWFLYIKEKLEAQGHKVPDLLNKIEEIL